MNSSWISEEKMEAGSIFEDEASELIFTKQKLSKYAAELVLIN